jgi:tubulin-specific chaperone A
MIEESEKMVIDTATRLEKAADVLGDLVVRARRLLSQFVIHTIQVLGEKESELAKDPALVKAKEVLEAAKA